MNKKEKQLRENLKMQAEVLGHVVISEGGDIPIVKEQLAKADVIILFKSHLGLGDCITKISGYNIPLILFSDEGIVNNPLDALEYIYPANKVWVAVDYQDINNYLAAIRAKKRWNRQKY